MFKYTVQSKARLFAAGLTLAGLGAGGLAAAPATAHDYVVVDVEDDFSEVRALDLDSITPVHDDIQAAWVLTILQGDKIEDGVVRRRVHLWYDCATPRYAIEGIELYHTVGALADDSWSHEESELEWDAIESDTVGSDTRDYVCGFTPVTEDDRITADDDNDFEQVAIAIYSKAK